MAGKPIVIQNCRAFPVDWDRTYVKLMVFMDCGNPDAPIELGGDGEGVARLRKKGEVQWQKVP